MTDEQRDRAVGDTPTVQGMAEAPPAGTCVARYRERYRSTAYYSTGRDWGDYEPAYRCGVDAFASRATQVLQFHEVESALTERWRRDCGGSRLTWAEARGAARDAWQCESDARHAHQNPIMAT